MGLERWRNRRQITRNCTIARFVSPIGWGGLRDPLDIFESVLRAKRTEHLFWRVRLRVKGIGLGALAFILGVGLESGLLQREDG